MLRGGWLSVVALIGLTLAGAAPPQEKTEYRKAAQQAQTVQPLPAPATSTESYAPYPEINSDYCYNAKNHDAADLCAQWRAAVAAEKAAKWAWWGNAVSGIGAVLSFASILLVLVAVGQTRKALKYADAEFRATRSEARASARHAAEAAQVAREQLVAGRRPWLSVKANIAGPLRFVRDGNGKIQGLVDLKFTIFNFGKSPAIAVLIYAKIEPWPFSANASLRDAFVETLANRHQSPSLGFIIVPEDKKIELNSLPIWPGDMEKVFATNSYPGTPNGIFPQILFCVAYNDPVTGKTHETGGTFFLAHDPSSGGKIISADEGSIAENQIKIHESIVGWYVT